MQSSLSSSSNLSGASSGNSSSGGSGLVLDLSAPTAAPLGGRSFASPAMIRILLAPAHPDVALEDFERWAAAVRCFDTIRLSDLPSSKTGAARVAAASPLAKVGEVHLSFVTSYDVAHSFLSPFSLHRQVLGVLGLATSDGRQGADLERAPGALRALHPSALVHRVFGFDVGAARPETVDLSSMADQLASSLSNKAAVKPETPSADAGFSGRDTAGLVVFPAVRKDLKDVKFYLRTLMPDFVASLLDSLDTAVLSLQGTNLETPRETLQAGFGSSASSSSNNSNSTSSTQSRASSLFGTFASSSSTGSSTAPAVAATGIAGAASLASKKTKRMSIGTTGPAGSGRLAKVRADAALLAGDIWSALAGYDTAMTALGKERALAGGQDACWYASALEGWAVARVLAARMGGAVEEKAPSLTLPGKEKERKGTAEKDVVQSETSSFAGQPWGEIAEAYTLALTIYTKCLAPLSFLLEPARSVTSETPRDYTHPLVHASACIAYSRFLLAIWASGGYNGEAFDQLIYGGVPPALAELSRPTLATYIQHSTASCVQRHDIAAPASQALTHSIAALKPPDQVTILSSIASIFGCIGFSRREAYLLRQLQAVVVSLLARAIAERPRRSSHGPAQRGSVGSQSSFDTFANAALDGTDERAQTVMALASSVCETYGINVDVPPLLSVPEDHILSALGKALLRPASAAADATAAAGSRASGRQSSAAIGTAELADSQEEANFGWAEQQVGLLKSTVGVCEVLGDHVGAAYFAALLLRDFHWLLAADEQARLAHGLLSVAGAARWSGAQDLRVRYWGPSNPVCSIEIVPLGVARLPAQRPAKQLSQHGSEGEGANIDSSVAGVNNPFFWNPTGNNSQSKRNSSQRPTLVEAETAEFLVTFRNSFDIALELSSVQLLTSGTAFDASELKGVTIPPSCYHTLKLAGTPRQPGTLVVRGCRVTLSGCAPQDFEVALVDPRTDKASIARATELDDRRVRIKEVGLDARPVVVAQRRKADAAAASAEGPARRKTIDAVMQQFLECQVVSTLPLLVVDAPSATHGALVLCDGERTTLRVQLTNTGHLPIDFVKLSFTDDLSEASRIALAEGDLLPSDVHAIETDLAEKPVLRYTPAPRDPLHRIAPASSRILKIQLRGKLDCSVLGVHVDYAHVDGPGRGGLATEESKDFFTRRASLALSLTVLPSLECGPLTVRPSRALQGARLGARNLTNGDASSSSAHAAHCCLLSFEVTNTQTRVLEASFVLAQDAGPPLSVKRALPANGTARIALPFPRLRLSSELLNTPIPSLTSRQFVVSKVTLSPLQQRRARARFWARQEIVRRLTDEGKAPPRWLDPESGRKGDISIDSLTLTDEQVDVLLQDDVDIALSIGGDKMQAQSNETSASSATANEVEAEVEAHLDLVGRVVNRSERPLRLLYRLVPLPSAILDSQDSVSNEVRSAQLSAAAGSQPTDALLANVLITSGSLSGPIAPWPLQPGEEARFETGVCFLCRGAFGFVAIVEEAPHSPLNLDMSDRKACSTTQLNVRVVAK